MKIETEIRDDHQVKLVVELDMDTQERFMRRAARSISKDTRIPGFRPGKAPYDVVKRHYGDKRIEEQAVDLLLEDIYPKALEEAEIEPSGPGQLESYPTFSPPVFTFIVPLKPVVELGEYQSVRVDYQPEPVTDEDMEQMIRRLQSSRGITEPVERPAEDNDMVYILLNSQFTQPEEDETPEITKDQPLEIFIDPQEDPEADPWPFPGFPKELVGISAGDTKTITKTFPEDAPLEKLREREVEFNFEVQSIKSVEMPEVDDEFVQTFGDFETVDDFRDMLRNQMETQKSQEYEESYMTEVIDTITALSSAKYPPHMIDEEIKTSLSSIEQRLASQHMDLQTYLKTLDTDKEAYIESEIKPMAEKSLVRSLVLEEILRSENIQLDSELLQSAVTQTMGYMQATQGRQQMPRGMKKQDMVSGLTFETANRMLNDQLMARIKAMASGELEAAEAAAAEAAAEEKAAEEKAVDDEKSPSEAPEVTIEETPAGEEPTEDSAEAPAEETDTESTKEDMSEDSSPDAPETETDNDQETASAA